MSVVGFDFGNVNSFIAVARQGGIETIANDYSLRATPSCVAFTTRGRSMGVAARQQLNTNIKNTIINFKHLLGRKFSDQVTQKYRKFMPCEMIQLPNDDIGLKVQYFNEERVFTPEQVVATFLVKLKDITENSSHGMRNVTDCVVSVPFYFADAQRRALLTAVRIAGLNCLQILNETTAVALAYGIYKQDLPAENEPPRIVAFIDVGHSAAQAVLVAYNKGKLTVLGATYDLEVGGLAFDDVIREYFSKLFYDTYKIDVTSNKRAWFRLLDECEKIKKQMSTNSTSIPLNIECFMNDMDVTGKMQRSQFEELAQPLLDRVRILLTNLLRESGKKAEEVESVELVGGTSRIPAIKKITFEVFGKEPKTTMNQDEAVARGAFLRNISESF
uniref:DnaK protein n=1 Tax=Wuchereria bancrofti TaxID=6293 RepID=A0A1I8EI82_WUCBA